MYYSKMIVLQNMMMSSLFQHHNKNNNNTNSSSNYKSKDFPLPRKRHVVDFDKQRMVGHNRNLLIAGLILFIIAGSDLVDAALRNVNLIIEPPAVRRGQHAILRCLYDLEGALLYSAKFYRGQLEFYRYTPGEFPNTKVFPFPGIHVDVTSSNATQVLIRNVGFGLSGNFSCEVTADAPLFSTATAMSPMQVVELPEKRPQLFTESTRYEPGDVLRANCSTTPSRPRAELKFTINNMVVNNVETQYIRTIDNLIASRISMKLQLQGIHFSSANPSMYSPYGSGGGGGGGMSVGYYNNGQTLNSIQGGGLLLRCTATIGELYQEYKEIELGSPQKDPVPARVTLSAGSSMRSFLSYFSSSAVPTARNLTLPLSCHLLMIVGIIFTLLANSELYLTLGRPQYSKGLKRTSSPDGMENKHSTHVHRLLSQR